jgi:hypothetical protein
MLHFGVTLMTRISKQAERRALSPRKPRLPLAKTGPKKDNLKFGYRLHQNALPQEIAQQRFIPLFAKETR